MKIHEKKIYNMYGLNFKINNVIYVLICFALGVNIITIATFPSWFDEAFFANISFNLYEGKGFYHDLIPGYTNGEVFFYGPVYFAIQAALIHLFGLHEFIFRLPNLMAGYISVLLLVYILKETGIKKKYILFFALAVIIDVSFNRNLVYGRMDLLALMFVLLSLFISLRINVKNKVGFIGFWSLAGVISAIAYLISPRALFLMPIVLTAAFNTLFWNGEKDIPAIAWYGALGASVAFIVPILAWINHVGGFSEYISMFQSSENVKSHIGFSFFRSYYDNVSIVIFLSLTVLNFRTTLKNPFLLGCFFTYLSFSFFVKEIGPYAAMITPIIIAASFLILSESNYKKSIKYILIAVLTVPGLFLIFLRGADIIVNSHCRDSSKITENLGNITNQKIVAPFKYYFIIERPDRDLVTLEYSNIEPEMLIEDADFIISSIQNSDLTGLNNFKQITKLKCRPSKVPFLPATFYNRSTFSEMLFKRI